MILLAFLLVIYVAYLLLPLVLSIGELLVKILYPIAISIVFYYLFKPVIRKFGPYLPTPFIISVLYLLLALVFVALIVYLTPILGEAMQDIQAIDFDSLIKVDTTNSRLEVLGFSLPASPALINLFLKSLSDLNALLVKNSAVFISSATQFVLELVTVPFIVFYLLKDDAKIYSGVLRQVPPAYEESAEEFLEAADASLLQYINGRLIISLLTTVLIFLLLAIIGIKYLIFLSVISFLFFTIPTIGGFIVAIPCLLVGFSMGLSMGFQTLTVVVVSSIIEGFIITPQVMGNQMYIHPLTILFLVLISGLLFGVFGLLIATPVYILFKVFLEHRRALFHPRRAAIPEEG